MAPGPGEADVSGTWPDKPNVLDELDKRKVWHGKPWYLRIIY